MLSLRASQLVVKKSFDVKRGLHVGRTGTSSNCKYFNFKQEFKKSSKDKYQPKIIVRSFSKRDSTLPPKPPGFEFFWIAIIAGCIIYYLYSSKDDEVELDWSAFKQTYLPYGRNLVPKIEINKQGTAAVIHVNVGAGTPPQKKLVQIGDVDSFVEKLNAAQEDLGVDIWDRIPVSKQEESYTEAIISISPYVILYGFITVIFYRFLTQSNPLTGGAGSAFGFGSVKPKMYNAEMKSKVTFNQVAGLDEAKVEVMEFVHFLKNPKKYTELGAKIPRGALLAGPPGTGKTLLAKAVAGEAGVPFFSISGSEFMEMFVGVGPARVRDLFAKARQKSPCIVFIDEIDAVGRKRDKSARFGNDERENTLNQLLVEMDGFNTQSGVIVLAGTNRVDILDPALLRPGRFDRTIPIDPPELKGRADILKVHLKNLTLETPPTIEEYSEKIAVMTPGFVGADLANICNEAALIAARADKKSVQLEDLENAIERVIGGLEKKNKVLSAKEKLTVAYHEAGHAVTGWFLEHANPLLKVSIIPRGSAALGYAIYQPSELHLSSKSKYIDEMCVLLGGRIAEELHFGSISTGASDDLEKVTGIAYQIVMRLGMSDKVGLVSYKPPESEMPEERIFSQTTSQLIDEEVRDLIKRAEETTRKLLKDHAADLEKVAQRLIKHEKLTRDDMVELVGPRPWKERRTYKELTYEVDAQLPEKSETQ